jgi:hypothetical protein
MNTISATPYRVSTITATGKLNCDKEYELELDIVYDAVTCLDTESREDSFTEGITYAEHGNRKTDTVYKGYNKKYDINRRKKTPCKRFDNQLTLVFKLVGDRVLNLLIKAI